MDRKRQMTWGQFLAVAGGSAADGRVAYVVAGLIGRHEHAR
jgi:hypothetical protein